MRSWNFLPLPIYAEPGTIQQPPEDVSTAKSCTVYTIMHTAWPIIWALKLQMQILLSITDSKYMALSQLLQDCIPIILLLQEFKRNGVKPFQTLQSFLKI